MTHKKKITLTLSEKLYKEVVGSAKYVGITKEEYLLFLVLRTQPIPVEIPVQTFQQFQPDTSMLEEELKLDRKDIIDKKLKFKEQKQEASYLG